MTDHFQYGRLPLGYYKSQLKTKKIPQHAHSTKSTSKYKPEFVVDHLYRVGYICSHVEKTHLFPQRKERQTAKLKDKLIERKDKIQN